MFYLSLIYLLYLYYIIYSSTLYVNSILSVLYIYKHTRLTLYQLHMYSLTASFSWKTNTSFIFLFFLLISYI